MLDLAGLLTDAVVARVLAAYEQQHSGREPDYARILESECREALSQIARSDALYHDAHHTAMVTDVGLVILEGKRRRGTPVSPRDWLHFVLSLLFHDIGMVGGVCRADGDGMRASGSGDAAVAPPRGSTDAWLAPYHVDRGKLCVRERFAGHPVIDPEILAANIERTRFPVPEGAGYQEAADLPGLVRAADLIGQLADPGRDRKLPALFYEFEETGVNGQLGFASPDDLRADYPRFFWSTVAPYVKDAIGHLQASAVGKRWIAGLLSHLPVVEMVEEYLAGAATSSAAES
jgi:hypothetical protein